MEKVLYPKNCVTLDGRMDEPVWEQVQTYTDFKHSKINGGQLAQAQTLFKIIPCEDRIYIGIKCLEPNMAYAAKVTPTLAMWTCDDVEVFFSPNNNYYDYYQFAVTLDGRSASLFYTEAGYIQPDPYAPEWKYATYVGDGFWSAEIELPLTAFYMTANNVWNENWLVNVSRTRTFCQNNTQTREVTSWCEVERRSLESQHFRSIAGFPIRPTEDDVRISSAVAEITQEDENGFFGTLALKTIIPEDEEFEFSSDFADTTLLRLKKGDNEFTVPCRFPSCQKHSVMLQLKRLRDGKIFKRHYPVRVAYEPIKLSLTKPEFRTNFYPGQDYSKVIGKVISAKPVTLTLEGAGIEKQVITPDAEGNFCFDTHAMEFGEALLTVKNEDKEITRKIRRLAPTGKTMSWISDGCVVVDGKPVLPRTFHAIGWHGGKAQEMRYAKDDLHETRHLINQEGLLEPDKNLHPLGFSRTEATKDKKPRKEIFQLIDRIIEANKDKNFTYYYISNEPECRNISPVYLQYVYDYLCEKDPCHLVRMTSRAPSTYVDTCDFFEVHPYMNPYTDETGKRVYSRPFETLGKFVDDLATLNRPDKCIGFSGTGFAGIRGMQDPYLTFDELICNDWSGLVRGAKSLRHYAYHDLYDRSSIYEGARYLFSSAERLEDILLFAERTTLYKSAEMECALFERNGEKIFVLVNFTQKPQTITLEELSGTWHHFRHGETITGPTFELKPVGVLIGTTTVLDAGLPSYQETAALVDELEYRRTHTGNLLFGHEKDVVASNSGNMGYITKIFDGVRDVWAWEEVSGKDKFYEIDVSQVKPIFNKVVVSGYNIADMLLKVRVNGELIEPAIAETQDGEFSKTFLLQEAICPNVIRMEFFQKRVELYEFEIFKV